ncbi:MAG: hypothetical protein ACRD8U_25205 [Pyrinomonadaceae bacterium]
MAVQNTSVDSLLKRADEFFMGTGPIQQTMASLAHLLAKADIDYAVAGGMALMLHGYRRETVDVDVLLTADGRNQLEEKFVGLGYAPLFPGASKRFRDTATRVEIDLIITGDYPGDGKPKPVSFPDPAQASIEIEGIRILKLEKLIELKLASGMTAPDRLRDLADVQELIKVKKLDSEFVESLNPYVREKYLELWNAVRQATHSEE